MIVKYKLLSKLIVEKTKYSNNKFAVLHGQNHKFWKL